MCTEASGLPERNGEAEQKGDTQPTVLPFKKTGTTLLSRPAWLKRASSCACPPTSSTPRPTCLKWCDAQSIHYTATYLTSACCGAQVKEVSDALSWCLDNIERHGGDPCRISAVGHSAGGHLVATVLIFRAAAAALSAMATAGMSSSVGSTSADATLEGEEDMAGGLAAGAAGTEEWSTPGRASLRETAAYLHGAGTSVGDVANTVAAAMARPKAAGLGSFEAVGIVDGRMPMQFVSMAGVFDITKASPPILHHNILFRLPSHHLV